MMIITPILLRYDYGIKSRGDSLEYKGFYKAFKKITNNVYPFWYDSYLGKEEKLQKEVINFVNNIKPDIIFFILYKNEFRFATLDYLKDKCITINWFCDDQWRFNIFTKYYAPHFTYSVTTDKYSLIKYKEIGYKNVILSQWASFRCSKNIDFKIMKYKYDVSFIGGISGHRKWIIKKLLKDGVKVECFGNGWNNGRISFNDMIEIFKVSRINLGISNSVSYDIRCIVSSFKSFREFIGVKKRAGQIKARNFEIPVFGGFQLTNYVISLEDYFNIGSEVATYISIDDLLLQVRCYLKNESERIKIAVNGYRRAINEHTYQKRLEKILGELEIE